MSANSEKVMGEQEDEMPPRSPGRRLTVVGASIVLVAASLRVASILYWWPVSWNPQEPAAYMAGYFVGPLLLVVGATLVLFGSRRLIPVGAGAILALSIGALLSYLSDFADNTLWDLRNACPPPQQPEALYDMGIDLAHFCDLWRWLVANTVLATVATLGSILALWGWLKMSKTAAASPDDPSGEPLDEKK